MEEARNKNQEVWTFKNFINCAEIGDLVNFQNDSEQSVLRETELHYKIEIAINNNYKEINFIFQSFNRDLPNCYNVFINILSGWCCSSTPYLQ